MAETRTFKNAMLQTDYVGDYHDMNHLWKISASEGHGNPYGTFSYEEWDMEVTFTKKAKPLQVGDWAKDLDDDLVKIIAIHGKVAWVTKRPDELANSKNYGWSDLLENLTCAC